MMRKLRSLGIWIFGLIGAAIFGGFAGNYLSQGQDQVSFGMIGGMCVFACARLWAESRAHAE